MKRQPDDVTNSNFLHSLEDGVAAILANPKATLAERLKAIEVGSRLLMVKNKIGDGDSGSFFERK